MVIPFVNLWLEDSKNRILIGQHPDLPHKPYPLKWDFPGGKIDPGEYVIETVGRELKEETGFDLVEADLHEVFHNSVDPKIGFLSGLGLCYKIKFSGDFSPDEMIDMHWEEKRNLKNYDFAPWTQFFLRDWL
jgi:8-oxo-dGTP diphosphatase